MARQKNEPKVPIARLANHDGPEPSSFPEARPAGEAPAPRQMKAGKEVMPKVMAAWGKFRDKVGEIVDAWDHHHTMMGRAHEGLPTWERVKPDPTPRGIPAEKFPEARAYAEPVRVPLAQIAKPGDERHSEAPDIRLPAHRWDPGTAPRSMPSSQSPLPQATIPPVEFAKAATSQTVPESQDRFADVTRARSGMSSASHEFKRHGAGETGASSDLIDALREVVAGLKELTKTMQDQGRRAGQGESHGKPGFQADGSFRPMGFDNNGGQIPRNVVQRNGFDRGVQTVRSFGQ